MIAFTLRRKRMDSGTRPTKMVTDWSRLSLKSNVHQTSATRFYLKFRQENQFESQNNEENVSKYSGSVDYKLL